MELKQSERKKSKIKVAIQGFSGTGKTYSALLVAHGITNDCSKICVRDRTLYYERMAFVIDNGIYEHFRNKLTTSESSGEILSLHGISEKGVSVKPSLYI